MYANSEHELFARPRPVCERRRTVTILKSVDAKAAVAVFLPEFVLVTGLSVVLSAVAIGLPLAAGRIAGPPMEPAPEPSAATAPAGQEAAPDRAATGASLAEAVDWRVAPSGEVKVSRAALTGGLTLEEVVFGADPSAGLGQTEGQARRPETLAQEAPEIVLGGETIPLEHRRTVHRYFESLRPN